MLSRKRPAYDFIEEASVNGCYPAAQRVTRMSSHMQRRPLHQAPRQCRPGRNRANANATRLDDGATTLSVTASHRKAGFPRPTRSVTYRRVIRFTVIGCEKKRTPGLTRGAAYLFPNHPTFGRSPQMAQTLKASYEKIRRECRTKGFQTRLVVRQKNDFVYSSSTRTYICTHVYVVLYKTLQKN